MEKLDNIYVKEMDNFLSISCEKVGSHDGCLGLNKYFGIK